MLETFEKHLYNKVFPIKPPENIYHYTTQGGILGILENMIMWATQVQFLNDKHEIYLTFKLIDKELQRKIGAAQNSSIRSMLTDCRRFLNKVDQSHICIASFCEKEDLLSQWRGYGNLGKGYAIGFELSTLKEIARKQNFVLWPCVYEPIIQRELVNYLVDSWLQEFSKPDCTNEQRGKIIGISTGQLAPILKDESFSEEKEWRLASSALTSKSPGFAFRAGQYSLIPYYNFKINDHKNKNGSIKSIVVGPSPHIDLASTSLKTFLRTKHLNLVEVKSSKIPFRNWK